MNANKARAQCLQAGATYRCRFQDDYLKGSLEWFHLADTDPTDDKAAQAMTAAGWADAGTYVDTKQNRLFRKWRCPAKDLTYQDLKEKHRKAINDFPIGFAFSPKQLAEVVEQLGPVETLINIGAGAILRKSDRQRFDDLFHSLETEMEQAKQDDEFLNGAIKYELGNHEYAYTRDPSDTIDALGLDLQDERINRVFQQARIEYLQEYEAWETANNA